AKTPRFVQLQVAGIDLAIEKLRSVNAPDPLASFGLLVELVVEAEWREPGRGTLRASKAGLAQLFGVSRHRISDALGPLETAALVRCEFVRGHDGEILVLAYDDLVRSALVPLGTNARPAGDVTRPRGDEARPVEDERPGKTPNRKKKEEVSEQEKNSDNSFECARPTDALHPERGKPLAVTDGRPAPEDALKERCVAHFAATGVSRDDCVRAIDQLRSEDIADHLIDAALGQAINAEAKSLRYLVR